MQPNLFIDGYNLLHAAGLARAQYGPGDLERARDRFLLLLSQLLDDVQRPRTVVVFDAKESIGFLGSTCTRFDMTVVYPDRGVEADAVLETMIRDHSAARSLRVVSSDRRIQVAAKRRKARPIDSEKFLATQTKKSNRIVEPEKPEPSAANPADIEFWEAELDDLLGDL